MFFRRKQKENIRKKTWQGKNSKSYSMRAKKSTPARKKSFSRWIFQVLLMGFFGICAYILFFSSFMDIDTISVRGNLEIPSGEIVKQIEKSFGGKSFGYFPSKNYFFVSKKNIGNVLKSNFNRLEVRAIEKKFPNSITINVLERKAEIVWCSAGVCYLAAEDGLIYDGAAGSEEELKAANYVVVVDDRARMIDIGKTKRNPDYIQFVEAVDKMLRDDLEIPAAGSYHTPEIASGEISVETSEGWIIKLSSELSIEEEGKIIRTLFEKELNKEIRKNLDYLDLRVRNKAFYKMKQEEEN